MYSNVLYFTYYFKSEYVLYVLWWQEKNLSEKLKIENYNTPNFYTIIWPL